MLRTTKVCGKLRPLRSSVKIGSLNRLASVRFISEKPTETFTKLSDQNDPQRDAFFKYSWGSWLKNDKSEKEKRTTKFSIEGLTDVLNDIYSHSRELAKTTKEGEVKPPIYNPDLTVTLPHNNTTKNVGTVNPNDKVRITSMASIHEGKHHRIYRVETNLEKSFVLRIPYALDNEDTIAYRLKSEVATLDFADLKLGMKVPKVFCYGVNALNPVRQPFILQEYIDGELLMRDWSPLAENSADNKPDPALKEVVEKIAKFQKKLLSFEFNEFGSLYFAKDYSDSEQPAYDGETNPDLMNRWRIGPTVERCFWRQKSALKFSEKKKFLGPWSISTPMDIVKNTGLIEVENAKARLALKQAEAASEPLDEHVLEDQIQTFSNLSKLAPNLFNSQISVIPNVGDLLKPRLHHPDLDPLNVIIASNGEKTPYLLDFEGASIKPFIIQNAPQFVAYDGLKIYDLKEDVPDYEKLTEPEKVQYDFMYKRTRNQYLWEAALNEGVPNLISAVAPPVKLLRSPYIAAIEKKVDEEFLLVEEALIQLQEVWEVLAKNGLVSDSKYPVHYTKEQIQRHASELTKFHEKLVATPFAATRGWIPQDMFDNLVKADILVKNEKGDHYIKQQADA